MISEVKIKALILEALGNVKQSEKIYQDLTIGDETIVLGEGSPFDSIAFTNFAVSLEEKIEEETGVEFVLNLEKVFKKDSPVTAKTLASRIASNLSKHSSAVKGN